MSRNFTKYLSFSNFFKISQNVPECLRTSLRMSENCLKMCKSSQIVEPNHKVSAYPELFQSSIVKSISGRPITGMLNLSPHKATSAFSK